MASGAKSFTNVQVIPAAGGEAKPSASSRTCSATSLAWSPDGTFLLFNTTQRTEQGQVARVDLVLRTPKFREDQFRELFPAQPATPDRSPSDPTTKPVTTSTTPAPPATDQRRHGNDAKDAKETRREGCKENAAAAEKEKAAAAKKPTEIVFDDIRHRLGFLPVGVDVEQSGDQPGWQDAAAQREQRGAAEPLHVFARRTGARAARRASADVDRRRQERRAVLARRQGGLLPRRRAHPDDRDRAASAEADRGDGGARRRLRHGAPHRVHAGVVDAQRALLRSGVPRRGLERGARSLRAIRGRRGDSRRAAAHRQPDDRRAERVAPRHQRAAERGHRRHRPRDGWACASTRMCTRGRDV